MKKELKVLGAIGAVVLAAAAMASLAYKNSATPPSKHPNVSAREELIRPDSPTYGPANAVVTIVEFLDPECESCTAYHPRLKAAVAKYEGRIRFVVRYMAFHGSSELAIAAAEAAGRQDRYWEMMDVLFSKAAEWGHKDTPPRDLFVYYAGELGLDEERFKKDLDDPQWSAKIKRDVADAQALGVKGTPTIFINGTMVPDLSAETLEASLARAFTGG